MIDAQREAACSDPAIGTKSDNIVNVAGKDFGTEEIRPFAGFG